MRRSAQSFLVFFLVYLGLGASGCTLDNPGDDPPEGLIYLPAGLLLSSQTQDQAPRFLYVVNSNFDLRYNAGSLQAYDLDALDAEIADCRQLSASSCELEPREVLADEVFVPSLATYITPSPDRSRIYVATRTQTSLTFIDVDENSEDALDCGKDRHCDDAHKRYSDPIGSERRLALPREAVGIVAGRAQDLARDTDAQLDGDFVMVAHRGGEVSLLLDDRSSRSGLLLQDVLTLGSRARPLLEPTAIAFDPETRFAYVTIFARDSLELSDKKVLARVGLGAGGNAETPAFLFDAGPLSMEGVSLGRDTRGIAMNPTIPGQALVVSRYPNSLMWVDVAGALDGESEPTQAVVWRTAGVGRGPSRVITGELGDRTIAIVSCFDARQIFILDAATAEPLSIVHNFSGPFELALDSARRRLYVADFRSSVIRVLDLAPIVDGASETLPTARIIATLGHPQQVQELQ
jgi:DNA-binding beta-propeller fold protein YncE